MYVISELLANNNVFLLCTDVHLFSMIAGWPWSEVVFDLRLHHIWIDKLLKDYAFDSVETVGFIPWFQWN